MPRLLAILRLLILFVCLVPFTSGQQALGALAPYFPVSQVNDTSSPGNEEREEDERETADSKERHDTPTKHRLPERELTRMLPALRPLSVVHHHTSRAKLPRADHFNNGLGTHYRC